MANIIADMSCPSERVEVPRADPGTAIGSDFGLMEPCAAQFARHCLGDQSRGIWVNDVHSQLNSTLVRKVFIPETEDDVCTLVRMASRENHVIAVSGSRHAMGGQQFITGDILIDTRQMKRVLSLDLDRGLIEVEAGIQWPELIAACLDAQAGEPEPWSIAQKQTGADTFTLGGSLSANIHGRGLKMKPLISNVESFKLVNASGEVVTCSRTENAELFRLAIGGYGLFGIISAVTLRLVRRTRVRRLVELIHAEDLMERFEERIADGCTFGDFQFSIDEQSPDFLKLGVFSCYHPTENCSSTTSPSELSSDDWLQLLHLAYTDRATGFRKYSEHYLRTHGQIYWSDTHQLSPYLPDYAARIRELTLADQYSNLEITELYVPRTMLARFLTEAAQVLRSARVTLIYGTVRLIEMDGESFLPWANQAYACIIFNLLTIHTPDGIAKSAGVFRELINLAIACGGNFYLTYHRHATRRQVDTCYPQFAEFLALKRKYDPSELFQSDWYRHYRASEKGSD